MIVRINVSFWEIVAGTCLNSTKENFPLTAGVVLRKMSTPFLNMVPIVSQCLWWEILTSDRYRNHLIRMCFENPFCLRVVVWLQMRFTFVFFTVLFHLCTVRLIMSSLEGFGLFLFCVATYSRRETIGLKKPSNLPLSVCHKPE